MRVHAAYGANSTLPSDEPAEVAASEEVVQDTPASEVVVRKDVEQDTSEPDEETPEPDETATPDYLLDDIALSYELQTVAHEAADTYGVPYSLLLAVMFKESSYNTEATNGTCWGLMQIHQVNHDWLEELLADKGVTDIQSDPASNIRAGAYLLGTYYEKYGDWNLALMAYNCGEAGAKKQWDKGYYSSAYSRSCIEIADDISLRITAR